MQQELNPSSKAPVQGVVLLFTSILIAGIVIGGVTSLVSNFIYLILLFPMLMGLGMSMIVKPIVISQKIRSSLLIVIAGIFAALIAYGSMHFFDYLQFRNRLAKEIQQQVLADYGEAAAKEDVTTYIDYLLVEETGMPGFFGYVLVEAKEGVSISHFGFGSSDSGINLGVFTWVYWLVEMGFIFWISIESSYKKAKDLFCEHCDAWVADGDHIGGVQQSSINQVIDMIKQRDFAGMLGTLQKGTVLPSFEFYVRTCKSCNTFPFYLIGSVISAGKKGQVQSKVFMAQALNSTERFALKSELEKPGIAR